MTGKDRPTAPGDKARTLTTSSLANSADSFDYSQVTDSAAAQLREHAAKIRAHGFRAAGELRQVAGRAAIAIGKELGIAKQKVRGDGRLWTAWVERECGLKIATAENMLRVAKAPAEIANTFAILPASALYEICRKGTPATVFDAINVRLEAGDVPTIREVKAMIASAKPAKRSKAQGPAKANRQAATKQQSAKTAFILRASEARRAATYQGRADEDVLKAVRETASEWIELQWRIEEALVPAKTTKEGDKRNRRDQPELRIIEGRKLH